MHLKHDFDTCWSVITEVGCAIELTVENGEVRFNGLELYGDHDTYYGLGAIGSIRGTRLPESEFVDWVLEEVQRIAPTLIFTGPNPYLVDNA